MSLPPHAALPLPLRPSLERYRKLAKDLLKAAVDPRALRAWVESWVASLMSLSKIEITAQLPVNQSEWTNGVTAFAQRTLDGEGLSLTHAQFVLARAHGFASWPVFAAHLRALDQAASPQARFEAAVDAIVRGDAAVLKRLLGEDPALVHLRSTRDHHATLLHYTAANGVEGYRQKTPANIVTLAEMLLQAGAEVDAEACIYGGGATTLMLAATSGHPVRAGVQRALLALLLDHGAKLDESTVAACLGNGCLDAAQFLAERGAHTGFAEAVVLGNTEAVQTALEAAQVTLPAAKLAAELDRALLLACQYGQAEKAEILVGYGSSLTAATRDGQTALHLAAIRRDAQLARLLLRHGAPLEAVNSYGATPLGQALWSAAHSAEPAAYLEILEALAEAGAQVPSSCPSIGPEIDRWLVQRGWVQEEA